MSTETDVVQFTSCYQEGHLPSVMKITGYTSFRFSFTEECPKQYNYMQSLMNGNKCVLQSIVQLDILFNM